MLYDRNLMPMSRRRRLLLLSVGFMSALLMLQWHILALQNGWYFSFKLLDPLVFGLGAAAVAVLLLLYIQSNRAALAVLILMAMLWKVFQFFFVYKYMPTPIPLHVIGTHDEIGVMLAAGFLTFFGNAFLPFSGKALLIF